MRLVDLTVHIPSSNKPHATVDTSPPLWSTTEFKFYYVVVLIFVPIMAWIPYTLSRSLHPNYRLYAFRLSPGWLFGRQLDNSDVQYRSFRDNIPYLAVAFTFFVLSKIAWRRLKLGSSISNLDLIPLNFVWSLIAVLILHGASSVKVILILSINYLIGKVCRGSAAGPVLTWIFNVLILFLNERYSGYEFKHIVPPLSFLDSWWQGMYPRWYISFNITMLRLVSFNMDYFWACTSANSPSVRHPHFFSTMDYRQRQSMSHPLSYYNYTSYLAYVLYPPLYIAGPIMSFNDFMWQLRHPIAITRRSNIGYAIRWVVCFLTMEVILHTMYVVAIKDSAAWAGDSPVEMSMIAFWNLMIVWLKLLLPWRFFRLWALLDGIDPPENMIRCMANNYSVTGFWRSWHRSYNLWIVRYIYVPVGGSQRVFLNSLLVFTFVALWHDLSFRLLAWGWLVSLFILPEIVGRYLFPASRYGMKPWHRHVCAVGAVLNVLLMMTANLVGFVVGVDGIKYFARQILTTWQGLRFLVMVLGILFVGVQLMFEYREEEARQGIHRRC
ncbi:MBOAT-domain-containing protein [Fistulina hepatica ATCC 64428]|nr:MBOAT-domain-containing protein [Fistulina hepatica ATCC 64428]